MVMSARTSSDALAHLMDVLDGQLEMLSQAAQGPRAQIGKLKEHAFDLLSAAVEADVEKLAIDAEVDHALRVRAREMLRRVKQHRASLIDVRSHLIALSSDWKCAACGSDAAIAASVVQRDPLAVNLVCRSCATRGPLTSSGAAQLRELFGHLGTATWNPEAHGFVL